MTSFRRLALFFGALLPAAFAAPSGKKHSQPEYIPNKYIVTLKSGISSTDFDSHVSWARDVHSRSLNRRGTAGVEKTYNIHDFNAYAVEMDAETLEQIKANPLVCCANPVPLSACTNACTGCRSRARPNLAPFL
jgi:oryzin